jgi:hypothetical protein
MEYKVESLIDSTYQVVVYVQVYEEIEREVKYQGSLADCEAWIRLTEGGYM